MRSRHACRTMTMLLSLGALCACGCQSQRPAAWGPTKTESGWRTGAGDSIGANIAQAHSRDLAVAAARAKQEQFANVRSEP